jgi:hypothetical protein
MAVQIKMRLHRNVTKLMHRTGYNASPSLEIACMSANVRPMGGMLPAPKPPPRPLNPPLPPPRPRPPPRPLDIVSKSYKGVDLLHPRSKKVSKCTANYSSSLS